jgi:hypothetical protein
VPHYRLSLFVWSAVAALGCAEDSPPETTAIFPPDFTERFTELRDCRQSIEHELEYVKLFVPPDQVALLERCVQPDSPCADPLPTGTLLIKPQYLDAACTQLLRITAAARVADLPLGDPNAWRWQTVSPAGVVLQDGQPDGCVRCHSACSPGFDSRCVMEH